ncbi:PEPxxWA-CTERM sorting domain-containing protein [Sphingomonas bacterium]|uniref:PEPxxWA-CTERM sorting domain-containing protein n=1 Tax=Sphingomonas bacterium TaxID=1895847 RepID=UPI0020C6351D|nr:PEPxxWA-CTERM sorting domain-containing protein [Sphingomonas bacterium]
MYYKIAAAAASLAMTSTPAAAAVKVFNFTGTFQSQSVTGYLSYDTAAMPSGGQVFPDGSTQETYTTGVQLYLNGYSYANVYINYIRGLYPTQPSDYFAVNGFVPAGGDAFGNTAGSGVTLSTRLPSGTARSLPVDLSGQVFTGGAGIAFGSVTVSAEPAVPEPATWAMMIGGFGLAGAALRRRRTSVAFA